jgi:hypothetical protein
LDDIYYIPGLSLPACTETYSAIWATKYHITTVPTDEYAEWFGIQEYAGENEQVSLYLTLQEDAWLAGYRLEKLTIAGEDGTVYSEITEVVNGIPFVDFTPLQTSEGRLYTSFFTMPAANVTITASFLEPVPQHDCPCAQFEDMPEYGTIEHTAIDWAFTHEPQITEGMDATHFGYGQTVTRAQAMRFLWNAAGQPDPASEENPFEDVKPGKWYTTPVLWAYNSALRITNGMDDTHFGINVGCTRAHIITFLWNAFGKPMTSIENPYTDVTKPDGSSRFYTDAAIWAYETGIEKGENGHFNPDTNCTRESIVVYLYRFFTGQGLLN